MLVSKINRAGGLYTYLQEREGKEGEEDEDSHVLSSFFSRVILARA